MLAKRIKYTDYNGETHEETFYFNLTKAEIMEMELGVSGGMSEMLKRIIDTRNGPEIASIFKRIILSAYGEKSIDGKHFMKSKEISENFRNTEAYSELFMELLTDEQALKDFMVGVMPMDPAAATRAYEEATNTIA